MAQFSARRQNSDDESPYEEQVVKVYRSSTVVKGGRRFHFSALVVVGDRKGTVGYGYARANEVPSAVEKGIKDARRNVVPINLLGTSIPHQVKGRFGATTVILVPASEGTGVIASAAVRAVLELAGVHDVLTKIYGSTGGKNVVKATMDALTKLHSSEEIEKLRSVSIAQA